MMPKSFRDNLAGHRAKYRLMVDHMPAADVGPTYVGSGDPVLIGFYELEAIRSYADMADAAVIDIGCGIGRLTQHLVHEPIRDYLGLDIIPEILHDAEAKAEGDTRFSFALSSDCKIPRPDDSCDILVAFSLITHLLDEEIFEYLCEARRVLQPAGIGIFSFLDYNNPSHEEAFFLHASQHRHGHGDLLRFTTQEILRIFSRRAGFASINFLDGLVDRSVSGKPSKLLDINLIDPIYSTGQSLCILRR